MQERNTSGRWQIAAAIGGALTLIAAAAGLAHGNRADPRGALFGRTSSSPVAVAGVAEGRGGALIGGLVEPGAPGRAAHPPLIEILMAADALAKAGLLPPPPAQTQPPLIKILQAADALAKAGLLPPPPAQIQPPLIEILLAADALAKARKLPPPAQAQPPLIEILLAADALAKAGKLPPPAQTQPSLIEILLAADALAKAGKLPPQPAQAQPSLLEILLAADALAKAGKLPPRPAQAQPSLLEILLSVQALDAAGALPGAPRAPAGPPPLAPAEPPAPVAPPPVPSTGWYDDVYSGRVRDLVNQERARAGLPPVATEGRLLAAASGYAKVLSDNRWFSHTGPDGSTFVSRIEAAGFPFTVQLGEILAWGTQRWSAEALVQAWMNSPPHREEILSPVYRRAGARCYFSPADGVTVYCVMDFAG